MPRTFSGTPHRLRKLRRMAAEWISGLDRVSSTIRGLPVLAIRPAKPSPTAALNCRAKSGSSPRLALTASRRSAEDLS